MYLKEKKVKELIDKYNIKLDKTYHAITMFGENIEFKITSKRDLQCKGYVRPFILNDFIDSIYEKDKNTLIFKY